jgi:hypothetical protein
MLRLIRHKFKQDLAGRRIVVSRFPQVKVLQDLLYHVNIIN